MRDRLGATGGQGLVEFALVIPLILLVIVGVFDAGRAVYMNSTLSQAAREGARLAAVEVANVGLADSDCVARPVDVGAANNPGAKVCPPSLTSLKTDVVDAVERMAVTVRPLSGVFLSCNPVGSAPAGQWTEASGGNGCGDGAGGSIGASGDLVSVRVEHQWQPITPLIGSILGPILLSGSASMLIN